MPLPVLPDSDAVTIAALAAETAITALVGLRIYDRIPDAPTWPLITVATIFENELTDPIGLDVLEQVDVWGAGGSRLDTFNARQIARTVRSVSRDLAGTYASGTVAGCSAGELRDLGPDPDTGRAHFALDLNLLLYA